MKPDCLILASASSIRKRLLENVGICVEAIPAHLDEEKIKSGFRGTPKDLALCLAHEKARKIAANNPTQFVLGCDQLLVQEGRVFDKPETLDVARQHIEMFSGHTHQLISAAVLVKGKSNTQSSALDVATMTVRHVEKKWIEAYVQKEKEHILHSVGAYRLEGPGIQLFEKIDGDYFTILGLPLLKVLKILRKEGFRFG